MGVPVPPPAPPPADVIVEKVDATPFVFTVLAGLQIGFAPIPAVPPPPTVIGYVCTETGSPALAPEVQAIGLAVQVLH